MSAEGQSHTEAPGKFFTVKGEVVVTYAEDSLLIHRKQDSQTHKALWSILAHEMLCLTRTAEQ